MLEADANIRVVGEAGTVAQGRRRILATKPDVALLDVRLPDGSGIDLCRELRQVAPDVRSIILTAYDDDALLSKLGLQSRTQAAVLHLESRARPSALRRSGATES